MMDAILDLSGLDVDSRVTLLKSTAGIGWTVTHQPRPKVHPDRKMTKYYYRFVVADTIDRRRERHVKVAMSR